MIWPLLAVGTALLYALHGAWSTRISRRVGALPGAWALYGFSFPILALYLAIRGLPPVDPGFWPTWSAAVAGHLLASYLFFSALKTGELSLTFPLLALTPIFVPAVRVGTPWADSSGWRVHRYRAHRLGRLLSSISARLGAGVLAPLFALTRDGAALRTLAVALIWSVTGTMDRVAVARFLPRLLRGDALAGPLGPLPPLRPRIREGRGWGRPARDGCAPSSPASAGPEGGGSSSTAHSSHSC